MNYLHSRVSTQPGQSIFVTLSGNEANVMVMDDRNFWNYQSGGRITYLGGHYRRSPAVIRPPAGEWNVVIDLGGYAGRVEAAVSVR